MNPTYSNRTLIGSLGGGLLGLLVGIGLSHASKTMPARDQSIPEVVRAQRFELVDEKGKVRAFLAQKEFGPQLFLLNNDREPAVQIGVSGNTASITLLSTPNKEVIQLNVGSGPEIRILDGKGKERKFKP